MVLAITPGRVWVATMSRSAATRQRSVLVGLAVAAVVVGALLPGSAAWPTIFRAVASSHATAEPVFDI